MGGRALRARRDRRDRLRVSLLFGRNFGVGTDIHTGPNGNRFVVSLSQGVVYEISRRNERLSAAQRFNVTFCTRQFVISPMSSSFSFRQSMELAMPNSLGSLPAEPNLPTTFPSSCTL
jgi:hypothetical protein